MTIGVIVPISPCPCDRWRTAGLQGASQELPDTRLCELLWQASWFDWDLADAADISSLPSSFHWFRQRNEGRFV